MKLDILETHDRLKHLVNSQWATIAQGAEDCLKKNPDSLALQEKCPYIYIFAHPRTHDNGADKRLLWQPRLTKPKPESNSYLFRAASKSDVLTICWLIPQRELWKQYTTGNVCESNIVLWSINQFLLHRKELGKPDIKDLSNERVKQIWQDILSSSKN